MIPYLLHPDAESELEDATLYYDSCAEGLGLDFSLEVFDAILLVREYPEAWPILEGEIRRCHIRRFPYAILYSIESDFIYVHAIMHLHRRPGYWKSRL